MNKILIVGLPRTGTTSVSATLLSLGFKVAHTAYTKETFELADALSDTPIFSDYQELDRLFPESVFIHLQRPLCAWLPSITSLLHRIKVKYECNKNAFHPLLVHSFERIFGDFNDPILLDAHHLESCYERHHQHIKEYFSDRENDLISIDISTNGSYQQFLSFINRNSLSHHNNQFPILNQNGQITAWKKIAHPLKINSNAIGGDARRYFDYFYE